VFNGLGHFKGLLDEVRIYDRGLTEEEVSQVYDGDMVNTGVVSLHAIELPQIVTTPATDVFPERATLNANVLSTGGVITVIDEIRDLTFNAGTAPGITGWYSASDMDGDTKDDLGLTYQNGAVVTSWKDSSGFMRDMTSTSGNPTYSMFGLNGKPVVTFDGDDKIWIADNYDFLTDSGYTVFSIARYTGGDNERVISSRTRNWLFGFHGDRVGRWHPGGWVDYGSTANTLWHMNVGIIDKKSDPKAWFWHDGVQTTSGSNGSNNNDFAPGQLQFGGYWTQATNETSKCEVAEVMIYKGMLSDKDRQAVEAYLAYKWDLMDTVLAANHPHKSANPFTGITRVYEVLNDGGDDPVVKIYWGKSNGGENLIVDANNSANWDNAAIINGGEPVGLGPVSVELSNLEADERYFFRAHAENIGGGSWSPIHKFFTASDSRLTKYTLDGLVFWLDANDIDGDGQPDDIPPDQPIGKWTDKSKSEQNATQTVGGFRPIYIPSSFEGQPAVRFASGEYLNVGTLRSEIGGVHAFAVAKGAGVAIGADDGSSGWTLDVKPGSRLASYKNESTNIDRVSIGNDPATGYGQFMGDIAEILVFDRFLPESEVQMIEGYLAHKWEVTEDLVGNSFKVKQGLELYFNFEEVDGSNVYDSSSKNRQGTLTNIADADLQVSGQFGSGIRVPAGDSKISLGVNDVTMASNWTISSWFTAPLTDTGVLLQHTLASATSNDRHVVFDTAGNRQLGVYNTINGFSGSGFTANNLSTGWHHLVAVGDVDNDKTIFYIDGNLVGESSLIGKSNIGVIGNFEGGDERFSDKLDEFRIYSRALSALDVSELYGNGDGDFGGHPYQDGPPSFDNKPKIQLPVMPLAHWTFDENNGTLLTDASGNGNTGTLLNLNDPDAARQEGKVGLGVKFDGINDTASINSQTAFGLTGSFAVTFWAKTSDLDAHLLRSGQFRVEALDGFVRGRAFIGPELNQGSWTSTDWTPFALDEWNHYALSYDGVKLRLFLNGTEATTAVPASGVLDWEGADSTLYLGGMPTQSPMTEGVFDDFRVFARALSIVELDEVYNLKDSALVARYGMDYSYQINGSKGPTDFNATNLPQGLSVDYSTGIISGKPETTGSFNVQVTVENPSGFDTGTINIEVLRGIQSISFEQALAGLRYGSSPIDLNASATSGLPVSFEVVSGSNAVDLNGSRLTIKGPGMAGIKVSQSGNENWFPAENVLRQIQIGKAELVIQAHDQFRKTGEPNPELTYDLTGFVNGENNSSLLSPVNITTIANVGSPAGSYQILPQEVNASNYFFTYLNGVLTVSDKKSQSLTFDQNLTNIAADSVPFPFLGSSIDEDGNATLLPLLYQIEDPTVARLRVTAQENLQSYWKFNEELYNSARDELGSHDGTLVDLATTGAGKAWSAGKFDNAISLGTANGYVHLGGVPLKDTFTISFWVKPTDISADGAVILSKDSIAPMKVFRIEQNATDGFVTATFHQDGNASTVKISSATSVLSNDEWTHVALVYSDDANGTLLLYANGNKSSELSGVTISGMNLADRLSDMYVGDAAGSMPGKVDDLRIYDSALATAKIAAIYGTGGGDFNKVEIIGAGTTKITARQAGNDFYESALPVDNYMTVWKVPQNISFDPIQDHSVGDFPFAIAASSSSGLPVSFTTSNPALATVAGQVVSIHGPGIVTLTALQTGDNRYEMAASVTQSFTIGYGNLFSDSAPGLKLWFDGNDVNADQYRDEATDFLPGNKISLWGDKSGNTNNPIQGTSSNMPVWQPNALNEKAVVRFDQSESFDIENEVPAARVIFIVHKQNEIGESKVLGGDISTTDAYGYFGLHRESVGLNLDSKVSSSNWSVNALRVTSGSQSLWIDGEVMKAGGVNSEVQALDKVGNGFTGEIAEALVYDQDVNSVNRQKIEGYLAHKWGISNSLSSIHPFRSTPPTFGGSQTITFPPLVDKAVGDPSFSLTAFASSGLPVSYVSSNPNVAVISGAFVTVIDAGTTTITAMQVGDDRYDPAHPVSLQMHVIPPVTKDDQNITFVPIAIEKTRDDPPFQLIASAISSGEHHPVYKLPVTFTVVEGHASVDSSGVVTLDGIAGKVSITANQSGSAYVHAALPVTHVFEVTTKQRQEIRFPTGEKGGIRDMPMNHRAFILQGVSSSGGIPLQITSSNSTRVRVVDGHRIVPVGIGTVQLNITAPGNAQFIPAPPEVRSLTVVKPTKKAWIDFRRGDVRYDGTRERFVRRLMAREGISEANATKVFDEDYSDSDGDGFSNLFERAIGSDSLGPDNWKDLPFRSRLNTNSNQAISIVRFKSPLTTTEENFQYHIEKSTDLRTWTSSGFKSSPHRVDLGAEMERVVYETDTPLPSGGRNFLRLRITTP
ncbi:MAG: hypothetical protein HN727_11945, partial [Opitutae bacterium]|nr:hypothetical protein [Opitutae bacterium]